MQAVVNEIGAFVDVTPRKWHNMMRKSHRNYAFNDSFDYVYLDTAMEPGMLQCRNATIVA